MKGKHCTQLLCRTSKSGGVGEIGANWCNADQKPGHTGVQYRRGEGRLECNIMGTVKNTTQASKAEPKALQLCLMNPQERHIWRQYGGARVITACKILPECQQARGSKARLLNVPIDRDVSGIAASFAVSVSRIAHSCSCPERTGTSNMAAIPPSATALPGAPNCFHSNEAHMEGERN